MTSRPAGPADQVVTRALAGVEETRGQFVLAAAPVSQKAGHMRESQRSHVPQTSGLAPGYSSELAGNSRAASVGRNVQE